jgi:hypothetical protein
MALMLDVTYWHCRCLTCCGGCCHLLLLLLLQVKETTRDVTFLHNEQFFAAAQKKYVYIYDKRGLEVHCLRNHVAPEVLEFLPHHFLLSSIGEQGTAQTGSVHQHKVLVIDQEQLLVAAQLAVGSRCWLGC